MTEGETAAAAANGTGDGSGEGGAANLNNSTASEPDPHFEPIVTLPEVVVPTMEEDEEEMIKLRAKLFRFDSSESPSEWKDRGIGDVKLLRHRTRNTVRVVMRRDKTLKICANHYVTPWMELTPNCGSDRAWVWSCKADYADETPRPELLAIRFANAEFAQRWKEKFEEAKALVKEHVYKDQSEEEDVSDEEDADASATEKKDAEAEKKDTSEVTEQLEKLNVSEKSCEPSAPKEKEAED
ncbi:Ran-specific GTPase-activating protein [Frankliniella fusca]|uniref:Ran-specific GTPase-activating protein n=1 Tax=Frankliniella fusca TaxID=407009 RepID=A0AAE1HJM0_9NEOP|nr:Ran-specific GTPase-activating protein [Frankliniella fusca]